MSNVHNILLDRICSVVYLTIDITYHIGYMLTFLYVGMQLYNMYYSWIPGVWNVALLGLGFKKIYKCINKNADLAPINYL